MTLTDFLLARIAEDEADARLATGHRYITGQREKRSGVWVHDGSIAYADSPSEDVVDWVYDEAWAHIARHDPARVLAECEAKRRIVEMHSKTATSWLNADGKLAYPDRAGVLYCELCSFHEQYEGFNDYEEPWPCPTLRILALPYADHPDFKPEWRV
jgi:hypothetical protein